MRMSATLNGTTPPDKHRPDDKNGAETQEEAG